MKFLEKLQNLPENKKKIILWTVVAILAVVMGFFWIREAVNNISKMGNVIPSIEIPQTTPSNK